MSEYTAVNIKLDDYHLSALDGERRRRVIAGDDMDTATRVAVIRDAIEDYCKRQAQKQARKNG